MLVGRAINAAGQVAGVQEIGFASPQVATGFNAGYHAFLYTGGTTIDLGTLGGTSSFSTAINARGWVVGYADIAADARQDVFLYRNGSMRDLGVGQAVGINAHGQIAGNEGSGSALRAFLLRPGSGHRTYLGSSTSTCTQAYGINDRGTVVGADCTGGALQAFAQSYITAGDGANGCAALTAAMDELGDAGDHDHSSRLARQLVVDLRVIVDTLGCTIAAPVGERDPPRSD